MFEDVLRSAKEGGYTGGYLTIYPWLPFWFCINSTNGDQYLADCKSRCSGTRLSFRRLIESLPSSYSAWVLPKSMNNIDSFGQILDVLCVFLLITDSVHRLQWKTNTSDIVLCSRPCKLGPKTESKNTFKKDSGLVYYNSAPCLLRSHCCRR